MLGGIEAGGTKFICAVGNELGHIMDKVQIPTTEPEETMREVIRFFKQYRPKAIGIGSFGPVDVNPNSSTFGSITSTPKKGWNDYPIMQTMKDAFSVPIGFNTDVNAAALGEITYGAAKGKKSCLYITVGTGIGAGAIVQGKLLQGFSHPEMGHILVRHHPNDSYEGKCPYHQDCLEGLAAGPAIQERWKEKAINLANRKEVWELEGYYLAQALMQYILILSPQMIIMGGGVMNQKAIFPYLYQYLTQMMNQYVSLPKLSDYIVRPGLGNQAGIIGSLLLANEALQNEKQ